MAKKIRRMRTTLERIKIQTYLGKFFLSGPDSVTNIWEIKYSIDNLPHKEQKFVCINLKGSQAKVFSISRLRTKELF